MFRRPALRALPLACALSLCCLAPAGAQTLATVPSYAAAEAAYPGTIALAVDATDLSHRIFRVRHHDAVARLEIARSEMPRALDPDVNTRLVAALKELGYQYVSLDLQGYRLGSLNEALRLRPVS